DRGYARKTRSTALGKRRLQHAEQLLKKRDEKGFHAELSRAALGYLGDRFNLDTHALTRDQLRTALAERAVTPATPHPPLAPRRQRGGGGVFRAPGSGGARARGVVGGGRGREGRDLPGWRWGAGAAHDAPPAAGMVVGAGRGAGAGPGQQRGQPPLRAEGLR